MARSIDPDIALVNLLRQIRQSTTRGRKRAIGQLLTLIPKLPGIRHDSHPDYLEALNTVLKYVQDRIELFRCDLEATPPDEVRCRFVAWVNGQLKYRILDLYRRKREPLNVLSLDAPLSSDRPGLTLVDCVVVPAGTETGNSLRLDGIEALIDQQQRRIVQRQGLLVELYIERDPEGRLSGCRGTKEPQLNCQVLARLMLLQTRGDRVGRQAAEKKVTWRAIAQQLQTNEQTVHSHWKRRCHPMLQLIAQEICADPAQFAKLLGLGIGSSCQAGEDPR